MSQLHPERPRTPLGEFFRGAGEVAAFIGEGALAVFELCIGKWPQPAGGRRRKPKPPTEGMGPVEKISPFPTQD
jgi:hypothetical protein